MALRQLLALATLANILYLASGNNQCYQCGYQQEIINGNKGNPTKLPGYPECTDTATQQDNKVQCTGEYDCCGSIRQFIKMEDTDNGESRELLVGRHDCGSHLKDYAKYNVLCSDHTDECVDIALDQLPQGHNETIMRAKICFCSGPLCNWHVPDLDTTAGPDTTTNSILTSSTTTSSVSGCSDNIAFSSGNSFPDAKIACYDENLLEVPFSSEETVVSPGTSCIFMGSGHPSYGLLIEMSCNAGTWVVDVSNV